MIDLLKGLAAIAARILTILANLVRTIVQILSPIVRGLISLLASGAQKLSHWASPAVKRASVKVADLASREPAQPKEPRSRGREQLHTVTFHSPKQSLNAVRVLREEGFEVREVYTPFAVHGMDEAMGLRETRLPAATLVGGVLGLSIGFGFQAWTHAVDWPLNIGGKSDLAWPALVPITFEVMVLLAAFATVGTLLLRGRLFPRLRGGTPRSQPDLRVTDDRFVLLIAETDGGFSTDRFQQICQEIGAEEVRIGWRVS